MAISYSPADPVPGDAVSLSITSATGQTDATRFELTSVPNLSALSTGILVDSAGNPVQEFTPDVAGEYEVKAYDYRRFSGAASYAGDPAGEARDVLVAVQTGTVYVGNASRLTIAGLGSAIDLRLVIAGSTVRGASLVNHTTEIARLATLDSTVSAAVDALVGASVASMGEDLITDVEDFIGKYNLHIVDSEVHQAESSDTANGVTHARIETIPGAIAAINSLHDGLIGHMTADPDWHVAPDKMHLPIAAKASDRASATVLLADLRRRVYSRHIDTLGAGVDLVHRESKPEYELASDSLLTAAIVAVLDYFAAQTPTTPDGENPGHAGSIEYGFSPES